MGGGGGEREQQGRVEIKGGRGRGGGREKESKDAENSDGLPDIRKRKTASMRNIRPVSDCPHSDNVFFFFLFLFSHFFSLVISGIELLLRR